MKLRKKVRLKAEMLRDLKEFEKVAYLGIHRAAFVKLFLGYAMFVTKYDEYEDHIVAHFENDKPLYFSYNSDFDYVLRYADEN